jgi:glycosyltransferase involved in cell wall biosynthesis
MRNKSKVYLDPFCKMSYSSFYIKGIYDVFGKDNVSFSAKYFKELVREDGIYSFDYYLALVVVAPGNTRTKIIIDFHDEVTVRKMACKWADKYAKININRDLTNKDLQHKLIAIAPGFGIKIWNFWQTSYHSVLNYARCNFSPAVSLKTFLVEYYRQYKRPPLSEYLVTGLNKEGSKNNKPYVFMIGTLWEHKNCIEGTNLQRKTFFETCKKADCNLEGGFFGSVSHPQYEEFKDMVFLERYTLEDYIKKTKLSAFVFNTPAVLNCHGWKLGEYLAMGKAIISTPLSNEVPGELKHGENIHIIINNGEMEAAINLLLTDTAYRKTLEDGARKYYLKYVDPAAVIENILKAKID